MKQQHHTLITIISLLILAGCTLTIQPATNNQPPATSDQPPTATYQVLTDGLLGPVGMALLPDGRLLIAEEGSGDDDTSAGITLITPEGKVGRLISGLPSSRDAGDLAGVPLVQVSPWNLSCLMIWALPCRRLTMSAWSTPLI